MSWIMMSSEFLGGLDSFGISIAGAFWAGFWEIPFYCIMVIAVRNYE